MELISIKNFPKNKIYVLLDKKYRIRLIHNSMKKLNCKNYLTLSTWINQKLKTKFNTGDVQYWCKGERLDKRTGKIHPKFMPISLVLLLIKLNKEKYVNVDKKIISYRAGGSGLVINAPILPIKVTPELDSIVIHLFGDGAAGNFTPSYTQKNKSSLENFIKKLENCFGFFEKSVYFTQGKYQVKFPMAITEILSNYYSIKSYRSHESKIPVKILNRKDNRYKLACMISFIVDEGNIRDVISLYSCNRILLQGIRKLIFDLKYTCSKIQFNQKANSYLFTLSTSDIERIYEDTKRLSKEFPTCNFSFKEENLRFIINRRSRTKLKNAKITKGIILNVLRKKKLSAQQISRLTFYAYCTIIHNLKDLLKEKKVKRIKTYNKTYLWRLCNKPN